MQLALADKLAFPTGRAPRFNPSHPAARNCYLSAATLTQVDISADSVMVNLLTGKPGVPGSGGSNPKGGPLHSRLGPSTNFNNLSANNGQSVNFQVPATDASYWTFGAICSYDDVGFYSQRWLYADDGGSTGGWHMYFSPTNGVVVQALNNSTEIRSVGAFLPVIGEQYFVAASCCPTAVHIALRNLRTGAIQVGSTQLGNVWNLGLADNTQANSGNVYVGAWPSGSTVNWGGRIAAVACASTHIGFRELQAWAADPWSFWYPRVEPDFLNGTGAASFLAAWAASSNRLISAGARTP